MEQHTRIGHDALTDIIVQSAGGQFDPEVVEAFVAIDGDFASVAQRFADIRPEAA